MGGIAAYFFLHGHRGNNTLCMHMAVADLLYDHAIPIVQKFLQKIHSNCTAHKLVALSVTTCVILRAH